MTAEAYGSFTDDVVAPLTQVGDEDWILELFHGPTLAFKDFAMQILGRLFDAALTRRDERVTIIAATSGDTGSAAIEALKSCARVNVVVLHPPPSSSTPAARHCWLRKS
jgi:threonine synthase